MIQSALQSPNCDLTTIRVATDLYINLGRFDQVEAYPGQAERPPRWKATPAVLAWANRDSHALGCSARAGWTRWTGRWLWSNRT